MENGSHCWEILSWSLSLHPQGALGRALKIASYDAEISPPIFPLCFHKFVVNLGRQNVEDYIKEQILFHKVLRENMHKTCLSYKYVFLYMYQYFIRYLIIIFFNRPLGKFRIKKYPLQPTTFFESITTLIDNRALAGMSLDYQHHSFYNLHLLKGSSFSRLYGLTETVVHLKQLQWFWD